MALNEAQLTEILKRKLEAKDSNLWHRLGEKPIPLCEQEDKKHGGAGADLCFLSRGETLLLIENKLCDAALQPRQLVFYLNHFGWYERHGYSFKRRVLVFIVPPNSKREPQLKALIDPKYVVPVNWNDGITKTNLSDPKIEWKAGSGSTATFLAEALYKDTRCCFTIEARLVQLDPRVLSQE